MKLLVKAGTTSQRARVFLQDSSSTTGAGLTGLLFNSANLKWSYIREDQSTATAVTLATATVGTWATGGFKEVDSTLLPGVYEISIPDAALASSRSVQMLIFGATNLAPAPIEIELIAVDVQDATKLGLTNLDAAITSRMASYTQPTGFLAATFPSGTVANTINITAGTITTVTNQLTGSAIATAIWQDATAGDFTTASSIGKSLYTSGAVPGSAGGHFIAGTNAATTVTTAFTTTFTGNLTGSVGSVTGLTTSTIATAILITPANKLATDASGNVAASSVLGNVVGTVGSVTGSVGSVTSSVTVGAYTAGQDPATLVLDVAASGHNSANSIGAKINAAASSGDPWATVIPGGYVSGTAGNILGNKAGFKLASDGVDAVVVETGINMRQALAGIGAATVGKASGLDTSTATYYAMGLSGTTTPRIVATTDVNGNRTSTVLSLPS